MRKKKEKYFKDGKTYYRSICAYCDEPIIFQHGEAKNVKECPNCQVKSDWILKPKTEAQLFELQKKYLELLDKDLHKAFCEEYKKIESEQDKSIIEKHFAQRNNQLLYEMYTIARNYTSSLLKIKIKEKGFYLLPDSFDDKVEEAVSLWFERFLTVYDFKIDDSWAGYLNWKIIEALYSNKEDEQNTSLDAKVGSFSSNNERTLEDITDLAGIKFIMTPDQSNINDPFENNVMLFSELRKFLHLVLGAMRNGSKQSYRNSILSMLSLLFYMQGDSRREDYLYSNFGNSVRSDGEKVKLALRNYIREMQQK